MKNQKYVAVIPTYIAELYNVADKTQITPTTLQHLVNSMAHNWPLPKAHMNNKDLDYLYAMVFSLSETSNFPVECLTKAAYDFVPHPASTRQTPELLAARLESIGLSYYVEQAQHWGRVRQRKVRADFMAFANKEMGLRQSKIEEELNELRRTPTPKDPILVFGEDANGVFINVLDIINILVNVKYLPANVVESLSPNQLKVLFKSWMESIQ